jgi:hypothetical protein
MSQQSSLGARGGNGGVSFDLSGQMAALGSAAIPLHLRYVKENPAVRRAKANEMAKLAAITAEVYRKVQAPSPTTMASPKTKIPPTSPPAASSGFKV